MFRFALRRLLWSIPTLLATSLVLFIVTTLAPEPKLAAEASAADAGRFEQARRARFLDLPSFVNSKPVDLRSRARAAVAEVAAGGPGHAAAAAELARLG